MKKFNQLILSHKSALTAIREYRIDKTYMPFVDHVSNCNHNNIYKDKIDLLVKSQNLKHKSTLYKFHVCNQSFIKNSLIHITNDIYCVNPELLILQMSNMLSFSNLYLLILELCGTYTINPENSEFIGVDKPITSVEKIKKFVLNLKQQKSNARGLNRLNKLLYCCENNSASPMESRLYIKLCGPRNKGFYGCKNLEMNVLITPSKKATIIAGQKTIKPDLLCKSKKVAIEYDSAQFHENTTQGQKDKCRRDALTHDGWKVFTIVPSQMNNVKAFDIVAKQILNALDQNSRIRNKNFEDKRNDAFRNLL